jgi:hypothetical protein
VSTETIEIAYTAYTQACTFLLDKDGFCRRIVMRGKNKNPKAARRCVGAQYVASLLLGSEGGLAEMPTVGAPLIFARIDDGRVSLVRTGPLERFVSHQTDELDTRERELQTLARTQEVRAMRAGSTSHGASHRSSHGSSHGSSHKMKAATPKHDSAPPKRDSAPSRRGTMPSAPPEELDLSDAEEISEAGDVVYHDATDRTQQLRSLSFEDDDNEDDDKTKIRSSPLPRKKGMLPRRS